MFFEVFGRLSLGAVELVADELNDLLDLRVVLQLRQEDELDVFVAGQTLLLFVFDIELENFLDISLDALPLWVLLVRLHNDREEGAEVENCFFHSDVIDEKLEAEYAKFNRVFHLDRQTQHVEYLHDEGMHKMVLTVHLLLYEHTNRPNETYNGVLALNGRVLLFNE